MSQDGFHFGSGICLCASGGEVGERGEISCCNKAINILVSQHHD